MNDEHLCLAGRNRRRSVTHPATTYESLYQSISRLESSVISTRQYLTNYRVLHEAESRVCSGV